VGERPRALEDVAVSAEFWRDKTVLVTGHTGFKGSWLALWLSQLGARVVGYALAPSSPNSNFVVSRVGERIISNEGDVCDLSRLTECLAEHRPEIVFHLAAQSLVRPSYAYPIETLRTNVLGTASVLEGIRRHPTAKAVVIVTSDKCYENREWLWGYRENEPMGGRDPYSSSKGCAELVTASFRSSYFHPSETGRHGVGVATARAGNVIGGGDWATDRLIPDILDAHGRSEELVIRNPSAVRPWQFVLEPLDGYMALAERLYSDGAEFSEAWNFGPCDGDAVSVEALVRRLGAHLEGGIRYRVVRDPALHEATQLRLDCSKASARLGWRPRTSVDDALRLIAEWQNQLLSEQDMQAVSLGQIDEFRSLAVGAER
jgi:CDP-glucose 4,6-dehydratase